jgi:hypothetical protein
VAEPIATPYNVVDTGELILLHELPPLVERTIALLDPTAIQTVVVHEMPRNCDVTGLETDEKDDPPLVLRKIEPLEPTATNVELEGDATPPNVREGEST